MSDMVLNESLLSRTLPVAEEKYANPYVDVTAGLKVHNRHLRILVGVLAVLMLVDAARDWKLSSELANVRPAVIRIHEDGTVSTAPYSVLEYKPQDAEVRFWLTQWAQDHYSLDRRTARESFARKMLFLPENASREAMEEDKRTHRITKFLNGLEPNVECVVENVLPDLTSTPYRAQIDFTLIYRHPNGNQELKREKFKSNVHFEQLAEVPASFAPINPLGYVVTYAKEYQWFTDAQR